MWTAQVPFDVETRPNPELKPGEIKVVQKGVPGEKTYTADFTAKGDQATVTPEEKQTKAPVNEIIEYGPAAEDTSVVTKVEKPVPFETEIVFDDTLAEVSRLWTSRVSWVRGCHLYPEDQGRQARRRADRDH
ncbi:G5 domain-containing protein [Corynebacterium jeikeium]|uniref:G5 domain-containing protein n=1 Tax=Corynebacterium jeikeium TaxID=38289 RepID=UPI00351AB2EE